MAVERVRGRDRPPVSGDDWGVCRGTSNHSVDHHAVRGRCRCIHVGGPTTPRGRTVGCIKSPRRLWVLMAALGTRTPRYPTLLPLSVLSHAYSAPVLPRPSPWARSDPGSRFHSPRVEERSVGLGLAARVGSPSDALLPDPHPQPVHPVRP